MIAGRMTERVVLLQPSVTKDKFGAETTSYESSRTVHAEVMWKSGGLRGEVGERFPDGRVEVIIRDAHTVDPLWRLTYQGLTYQVAAVEHNRVKGLKRLICDRVNE